MRGGHFIVLAIGLTGGLEGAPANAADFLSNAELKEFFAGRVVDTQAQDGVAVTFHFDPNGTFRAFFNRPKNPHWSLGAWWVSDENTMCTKNDKGETLCHKYGRDGDKIVRYGASGAPIRGKWEPRL